jgi:hypothetical protein
MRNDEPVGLSGTRASSHPSEAGPPAVSQRFVANYSRFQNDVASMLEPDGRGFLRDALSAGPAIPA